MAVPVVPTGPPGAGAPPLLRVVVPPALGGRGERGVSAHRPASRPWAQGGALGSHGDAGTAGCDFPGHLAVLGSLSARCRPEPRPSLRRHPGPPGSTGLEQRAGARPVSPPGPFRVDSRVGGWVGLSAGNCGRR